MKLTLWKKTALLLLAAVGFASPIARGQTTAFTYQGRLNDGGPPANGSYDLQFTLFDSGTNGNQLGPILTNTATLVSNGLFTATLDFGGQFTGGDRWLELAVATNASGYFVTLSPRQRLTPSPYAITANSVLPGGIPAGVYTNAVVFNNANNRFYGSGEGMTNLSFNSLAAGSQTQFTNIAIGAASAALAAANAYASTNPVTVAQLPSGVVTNGAFKEGWRFNCYGFSSGGDPRLDWGYGQNGMWLFSSTTFTNNFSLRSFAPIYQDPHNNFIRDSYVTKLTDATGRTRYLLSYTTHFTVDDVCSGTPGPGVALSDDGVHFTFLGDVKLPNGANTNCYAQWSPKFHLNARIATVSLSGGDTCNMPTNAVMYDVNPTNLLLWSNPRPIFIPSPYGSEISAGVMIYTNGLYYYFSSMGEEFCNNALVSTGWQPIYTREPSLGAGPCVFNFKGLWYWFGTDLGTLYMTSYDLTNWTSPVSCGFASQEGSVIPEQYAVDEPTMLSVTNTLAAMGDTNLIGSTSNGVQVVVSLASLLLPVTSNRIVSVNGSQVIGAVSQANGLTGKLDVSNLPASAVINYQNSVTLGGTFNGTFNGYGSGLANLNAASLVGTIPTASLPGITTNISNAGITFYITNGLIMRVSVP